MQVAHIFQAPLAHLAAFEALCTAIRRLCAAASIAAGHFPGYCGAVDRLCLRLGAEMASDSRRLTCVALYSSLHAAARSGDHSAVLEAVDAYLQE